MIEYIRDATWIQITHQDSRDISWAATNGILLQCATYPQIEVMKAFLRGSDKSMDDNRMVADEEKCDQVCEAIDQYNREQMDKREAVEKEEEVEKCNTPNKLYYKASKRADGRMDFIITKQIGRPDFIAKDGLKIQSLDCPMASEFENTLYVRGRMEVHDHDTIQMSEKFYLRVKKAVHEYNHQEDVPTGTFAPVDPATYSKLEYKRPSELTEAPKEKEDMPASVYEAVISRIAAEGRNQEVLVGPVVITANDYDKALMKVGSLIKTEAKTKDIPDVELIVWLRLFRPER